MNILVNDQEIIEKYNKIKAKLKIYLGKNLIVSECMMINT